MGSLQRSKERSTSASARKTAACTQPPLATAPAAATTKQPDLYILSPRPPKSDSQFELGHAVEEELVFAGQVDVLRLVVQVELVVTTSWKIYTGGEFIIKSCKSC